MKVHDLKPAAGSTKKAKRVGRGTGGKGGKTAGRGTKGQRARNTVARGFEGGQMPLKQRVPKLHGFNNPFRVEYQAVNLHTLERPRRAGRRRHHPGGARRARARAQGRLRQDPRPRRDHHEGQRQRPRRVEGCRRGDRSRRWLDHHDHPSVQGRGQGRSPRLLRQPIHEPIRSQIARICVGARHLSEPLGAACRSRSSENFGGPHREVRAFVVFGPRLDGAARAGRWG